MRAFEFSQATGFIREHAPKTFGTPVASQLPRTSVVRQHGFQETVSQAGPPGVQATTFFISPK